MYTTRHSLVLLAASTFGLLCANLIWADEDAPYSDAAVRKLVERIEVLPGVKKREPEEQTLGSWEFVSGRRTMTRKKLFAGIGVDEKRLDRPSRGFFDDVKFATWQLSPSYSISISYATVTPPPDSNLDDGATPIVVYIVAIIRGDKDSVLGP